MSALRIAVPNKGALSEATQRLLADAGYVVHRRADRALRCDDPDNNMQFFFQRPRDIAVYIGSGALDVGVTGLDLLKDSEASATVLLELGFGKSRFHFAAGPGSASTLQDLAGLRVATTYPRLVAKYLSDRGIHVSLVELDGAVENAIELGFADAVADVVETGHSLRSAGLVPIGDPVLLSQAVLIRSEPSRLSAHKAEMVDALLDRLRGVLTARRYVIVEYDCPLDVLSAACDLTPGIEAPTLSPLAHDGWVAVRSLVERGRVQKVMDDLSKIGARAILVTALEACRM